MNYLSDEEQEKQFAYLFDFAYFLRDCGVKKSVEKLREFIDIKFPKKRQVIKKVHKKK